MLMDSGMLTRHDDPSHKQKAIYSLTEMSIALVPVLAQLGRLGSTLPTGVARTQHTRTAAGRRFPFHNRTAAEVSLDIGVVRRHHGNDGLAQAGRGLRSKIAIHSLQFVRLSLQKHQHSQELLCCQANIMTAEQFAREFTGVKHRAQFIAKKREVRYYNDSIASSPTRTLATIRSFKEDWGRINIILGGVDKNLDYTELASEGKNYFRNIVLVGAAKEKIRRAFIASGGDAANHLHDADTFEEAVELIAKVAMPGDVVILSPACASFDMFRNFEKRGERFEELVLAME